MHLCYRFRKDSHGRRSKQTSDDEDFGFVRKNSPTKRKDDENIDISEDEGDSKWLFQFLDLFHASYRKSIFQFLPKEPASEGERECAEVCQEICYQKEGQEAKKIWRYSSPSWSCSLLPLLILTLEFRKQRVRISAWRHIPHRCHQRNRPVYFGNWE